MRGFRFGLGVCVAFICVSFSACGDDSTTPPMRCGAAGECPMGLRCVSGFCIPDDGSDAGQDAASDAPADVVADTPGDVATDVAPDVDPCAACGAGTLCRDGMCLPDFDEDGFPASEDCDDDRPDIFPGAEEICSGEDRNCDEVVDDTCPCPAFTFEGHRYFFCNMNVTWDEARSACLAVDGFDLVGVDSAEEDTFVTGTADRIADERWWIGLNDIDVEGTFTWSNGSTSKFRNWSDGQPDDAAGGEDCVHLNRTPTDRLWNDLDCDRVEPYICEEI